MSKKKHDVQNENQPDDIELVLLKTASNNQELDLIKNLLDENSIPYILKDHGSGGYMRIITGSSLYGTDVLVEKMEFEEAKAILNEFMWNE
jgi:hypothetical protein